MASLVPDGTNKYSAVLFSGIERDRTILQVKSQLKQNFDQFL